MRKNNLIWIFGLIFIIGLPEVFAQTIFDSLSSLSIFTNSYFILFVNSFIIWAVLYIAQAFIIPKKEGKEKAVIFLISLILAFIIAWNLVGSSVYIWNIGGLPSYLFNKYFLVNVLIIAGATWFGLGLLGVNPTLKQGQIGMAILVILISGLVANNIGNGHNKFVWDSDNAKAGFDYLFGPERTITVEDKAVKEKSGDIHLKTHQEKLGGILRPEKPYRLFVFLLSGMIFAWFFQAYLNITTGGGKLSWAIAFLVGANLARTGTEFDIVLKIAEAFAFLLILKQIPPDIIGVGGLGGIGQIVGGTIRYLVAAILVGFIFCTAFGVSNIGTILKDVPGINKIIPDCPGSGAAPGGGHGGITGSTGTTTTEPPAGDSWWETTKSWLPTIGVAGSALALIAGLIWMFL